MCVWGGEGSKFTEGAGGGHGGWGIRGLEFHLLIPFLADT